jgi:hypothetical protein
MPSIMMSATLCHDDYVVWGLSPSHAAVPVPLLQPQLFVMPELQ